MRNRFVKVTFDDDERPWYTPVELRNGNLYLLCDVKDMICAQGFGSLEDAKHYVTTIDAIEQSNRRIDAIASFKRLEHPPAHPERCDCKTCRPELYL
jgi:hypothetical protein